MGVTLGGAFSAISNRCRLSSECLAFNDYLFPDRYGPFLDEGKRVRFSRYRKDALTSTRGQPSLSIMHELLTQCSLLSKKTFNV